MPATNIYGLPFEEPSEQPGITLHGGIPPSSEILAEEVEEELARVEGDVAGVAASVTALEAFFLATGAQQIDTIDTGLGTNTTEFTNIPQTFRDLVIFWMGRSDGAGEIDSLAIRFNSDDGNVYTSRLSRNTAAGAYTTSVGTFTVLRAGHVGTAPTRSSGGTVWIPGYSRTDSSKMAHGVSLSRGQSFGDNVFTSQAGGTWPGTSGINSVRIWVSGQLWQTVNPHITLIGIP